MVEQAEGVEGVANDLCDSPGRDEKQDAVFTLDLLHQWAKGVKQRHHIAENTQRTSKKRNAFLGQKHSYNYCKNAGCSSDWASDHLNNTEALPQ